MMTPDEAGFQEFLSWLRSAPPGGNVESVLRAYRSELLSAGASEAEANGQLTIIQRSMKGSRELWPLLFDTIYASDAPTFRAEPNALLAEAIRGRSPGAALEPCMGEGRNAVYLAEQGWDVTGFDVSETGLAKARARAAAAGVRLDAVRETSEDFDLGVSRWALIALIYAPVVEPAYLERLKRALEPGGIIVVESFASARAAARRPVDIDPDDLRSAFSDFAVLRFEDTTGVPDWDQRPARVVRFVAEKPALGATDVQQGANAVAP